MKSPGIHRPPFTKCPPSSWPIPRCHHPLTRPAWWNCWKQLVSSQESWRKRPSQAARSPEMNSLWMVFFRKKNTPKPLQKLICRPEDDEKKKTPRPSQKKDHESDISEIDISTSKRFGKGQSFNFGSELKTRAQGRTRI